MKQIILALLLVPTLVYAAAKIQNADIKSNAGINFSKMESLTGGRVIISSQGGVAVVSGDVTSVELGYIKEVTGDVQAQLNGKESQLTFSTGLTRTANSVAVNSSQSIATLSNLSTNGFVKTGSGVGTLSVQTSPIPVADTTVAAQTISGTDIDWSTGSLFLKSITTVTSDYTFSNKASGQVIVVEITQTTGTPRWPLGIRWAEGVTPDVTANSTDVYTFVYDGVNTTGSAVSDVRAP